MIEIQSLNWLYQVYSGLQLTESCVINYLIHLLPSNSDLKKIYYDIHVSRRSIKQ